MDEALTFSFSDLPITTTSRDIVARVSGRATVTKDDDGTLRRIQELYVFDENRVLLEVLPNDPFYRPVADALQLEVNSSINAQPKRVDAENESA